jgi:hypothetical protein
MFAALTRPRQAVGALAANVSALADTVATVNAHLRQRLSLDGQGTPALSHQPAWDGTNGIGEGQNGRTPSPLEGTDGGRGKGRRRVA